MIRIGIVGTGRFANYYHARQIEGIRGARLVACCDPVEDRVQAFAKEHKVPEVYLDYKVMLDEAAIDAVIVAASDPVHAPVSIAAAKRGIAVLCEKPLATSRPVARSMVRAVKESGVVNMVHFIKRGIPAIYEMVRRVARGDIGEVRHLETSYYQGWLLRDGWQERDAALWRLSSKHSKGTLGDLGSHILDLASLTCGNIERISCRMRTYDKGVKGGRIGPYQLNANDSFVANVQFQSGAIGTLQSTRWASGFGDRVFQRVCGTEGTLEVDVEKSFTELRVYSPKRGEWEALECRPAPTIHKRFVRWLQTGEPDDCDFANGAKIQAYMDYCERSDREGKEMRVRA